MANPNILNLTSVTRKGISGTLSNAQLITQNLIVAAGSTMVVVENLTIAIANNNLYWTTNNANVNIAVFDSSSVTTKFLQFNFNVPAQSTGYFIATENPIFLEEGDALQANAACNLTVDYLVAYKVES